MSRSASNSAESQPFQDLEIERLTELVFARIKGQQIEPEALIREVIRTLEAEGLLLQRGVPEDDSSSPAEEDVRTEDIEDTDDEELAEFRFIKIWNPDIIKREEEALFRLSRLIVYREPGTEFDPSATERILEPLIYGSGLHKQLRDNQIAFSLLGELLDPIYGELRFLPQCSREWLIFRRLFLRICDHRIPDDIRDQGIWTKRNIDQMQLQFKEYQSKGIIRKKVSPTIQHPWEEEYVPHLATIKAVCRQRLNDYSSVTREAVKEHFVTHGSVSLDEECGAIYEIVQRIDQNQVPGLQLREEEQESILGWLRKITAEKGYFDFDREYERAARSVRGVLFDVAEGTILGKGLPSTATTWELQERVWLNRLIQTPYSVLTDESILFFLADGLARKGKAFADRLSSRFEAIERGRPAERMRRAKHSMALLWLWPEYPLWLMTEDAMLAVMKLVGEKGDQWTREGIREYYKHRKKSNASSLHRGPKPLITKVHIAGGEVIAMDFARSIEQAQSAIHLKKHVECLREGRRVER